MQQVIIGAMMVFMVLGALDKALLGAALVMVRSLKRASTPWES